VSTSFPPPPQNCGSGKDFIRRRLDREKPGEQRYKDHAYHGYTSTGHELFHTQIGVGNRLDGGRRRIKKYLWSFLRTAPVGQVRL